MKIDLDKVGRRARLLSALEPDESHMTVASPGGVLLTPTVGLGLYATITSGAQVEIVLITAGVNNTLSIVRGQDGTYPGNFRAGACIETTWNRSQMIALIESLSSVNNASGISETIATPGLMVVQNGLVVAYQPTEGC